MGKLLKIDILLNKFLRHLIIEKENSNTSINEKAITEEFREAYTLLYSFLGQKILTK